MARRPRVHQAETYLLTCMRYIELNPACGSSA